MIDKYAIRTDLAMEQKERFEADNVEVQGVILEEEYDEEKEIRITTVKIETENGAKMMKKPVGTYVTFEAPNLSVPDEEYHSEIAIELAKYLTKFVGNIVYNENVYSYDKAANDKSGKNKSKNRNLENTKEDNDPSILVVGLGNRKVTPDALGPYVADNLNITRHIVKEYGKYAMGMERVNLISAIVPGVMGQTGMETVEIIRGVAKETKPDVIIAIDALAARSSKRLNRTIQIADTGIHPGSGVGNHRSAITKETVGVPVIAIGVPTVVDAATIVNDTMENLLMALETSETLKGVGVVMQGYSSTEKYELVKELISPNLNGLFVTPKDIDETVKRISYTISEALNQMFNNEL